MISYTLLGTNDLGKAGNFYDALLGSIGARRGFQADRLITWTTGEGPLFGVCNPADGNPASVGNGTMISLHCDSPEKVEALFETAISLGVKECNHLTIHKTKSGQLFFYGRYVRDFDGNKLCFCFAILG